MSRVMKSPAGQNLKQLTNEFLDRKARIHELQAEQQGCEFHILQEIIEYHPDAARDVLNVNWRRLYAYMGS